MSVQEPVVTVAVVSYNTRDLLLRCLDSLAADVAAGQAEVVVVDNGSSDGSAAAARRRAPWVEVREPGRNLGFGAAVNAVAAETRAAWVLAANGDVALEPGALGAMLQHGAKRDVAAVAPRLLLPDGQTQHSVHPFPTLPVTLTFAFGLHRLSSALSERLCLDGGWDPERPRTVPWAVGACLLLRRSALREVGGFDERQWLYAEDVDLAWRLRERGWRTAYEPGARVRHAAGASTGSEFGARRMGRALAATYAMLRRRRGALRMGLTAAINVLGAAGRAAWMTPLALIAPRWRDAAVDQRRWCAAHLRGALGAGRG